VATVPLDRLLAFRDVSEAPDPLKVVAVAVPLTLSAPLSVVVPIATLVVQVEETPATVPVKVGAAESTTLPVPVDPVVHAIAVPLVAVQKSLVVRVPKLTGALTPMPIHAAPLH
jgi:hypothetical protein